jgi:hypothetical protein
MSIVEKKGKVILTMFTPKGKRPNAKTITDISGCLPPRRE